MDISKPPAGFQEIAQVAEQAFGDGVSTIGAVSTIGVVSDYLPTTKSRGTDFVATFTLTDLSWNQGLGLKFRIFGRTEEALPQIRSNGDVVVLWSAKLNVRQREFIALAIFNYSWTVFHQQDIPINGTGFKAALPYAKSSDQVPPPSEDMMTYAVMLCNFQDRSKFGAAAPITSLQLANIHQPNDNLASPPPKKYQLIKDLVLPKSAKNFKFADLLGEVRKIYVNDYRVELTISDYTSNEALYNYVHASDTTECRDGDEYNYNPANKPWPGPWGKMSLLVAAWDSHAAFARENVALNNLVFLSNVQIGYDKDGNKLEGKLRGDRKYPDRIRVRILQPRQARDDDRVKDLLRRKRDYEVNLKLHGIKGLEQSQKQEEEKHPEIERPAKEHKLSKTEKNNKKRREKLKAKKNKTSNNVATTSTDPSARTALTSKTLNPNIRTNKVPDHVLPLPISQIMFPTTLTSTFPTAKGNPFTLPFKNNLYHLKPIRVIDFHPSNIADFAALYKPSEYEVLSDYESDSDINLDDPTGAPAEWEWRFELLIEDVDPPTTDHGNGQSRMKLLIAGPDAEFLLRDIPATDLRADERQLARLKEKLFLLWGDLLERKEEEEREEGKKRAERLGGEGEEGVSGDAARVEPSCGSRPFECLVKEYGVQDSKGGGKEKGEWTRVFAMFGTSIVT